MNVRQLPQNHPMYASQQVVLERMNQLIAVDANFQAQMQDLLNQYFEHLLSGNEEFHNISLDIQKRFSAWLIVQGIADNAHARNIEALFTKLDVFFSRDLAFYNASRKLMATINSDLHDGHLKTVAREILGNATQYRDSYVINSQDRHSVNHNRTLTQLIEITDKCVKDPLNENHYNEFCRLTSRLPRKSINGTAVGAALFGSALVFLGVLSVLFAIAASVATYGAAIPASIALLILGGSFIGAGIAMILKRDNISASFDQANHYKTTFKNSSVTAIQTTCRLFKRDVKQKQVQDAQDQRLGLVTL